MIIPILIAAGLLIYLLQRFSALRGLKSLEEGHAFSDSGAEVGEEQEILLSFANHSRFFIPFLQFEERLPEGLTLLDPSLMSRDPRGTAYLNGTAFLGPKKKLERRIPFVCERRGRYLLSQLIVSCGDFLGLGEESRRHKRLREMIVYPPALERSLFEPLMGSFLGDLSVRRFLFEDPVLTLGFREYSGREPMKRIAWTRSAGSAAMMVKNFDFTTDPAILVLVNTEYEGPEREEKLERCFSAARTLCEILEEKNIPYDFAMNAVMPGASKADLYIPEGMGRRHFYGILECLGRASYETACSLRRLLEKSLLGHGGNRGVFLITPGRDPVSEGALQAMEEEFACLPQAIYGEELA